MTAPCGRCNRPVRRDLAAALHQLRGGRSPVGRMGPDITGLAVEVFLRLEAQAQTENQAGLFTEAFTRWAGISPSLLVEAVQHLSEDLPTAEEIVLGRSVRQPVAR